MTPATWKGVVRHFKTKAAEVQNYFEHLPGLAEDYTWQVCLAYSFSRVETAHHMALYCGVAKKHRANTTVARSVIDSHHFTRKSYQERFKAVFGGAMPSAVLGKLNRAEKVRDKVMHGKAVTEATMRQAIVDVLDYADALNKHVNSVAGFQPFGKLRGFKGRGSNPLDGSTTRWLLKGMGFHA